MPLSLLSGYGASAFAMESMQLVSVDKVYSRTTIDDDFDDNTVIVVLDRTVSGVNKRHNPSFFGEEGIVSIEDLTVVTDRSTVIDERNWEQVLLITFVPNRTLDAVHDKGATDVVQLRKADILSTVSRLESIDGIKFVGPNRSREVEREPSDPMFTHVTDAERGQWGIQRIQTPLAWDTHTGNANVRVGIIDTGVGNLVNGNSNHPDLNANLIAGVENGAGDYINFNTITNRPGAMRADTDGHGTHVAGIVGAVGDNGIGVSGVNWNVSLVPMQVANGGVISDAACVRAVNWARNNWNTAQRISILQFSIGGYGTWTDLETVIRQYSNLGGLFVCSTGNIAQDNDVAGQHHYPSFYSSDMHTNPIANMIAVGRSDINDERPTGTGVNANWGRRTITLFAPGHNIVSTYPVDVDSNWGVGYHRTSGSSMATPMVSGVAALLLSANPNLTGAQLRAAIVNNVDVVEGINNAPTQGRICVTGGRLNAHRALMSVLLTESGGTITGVAPGVTLSGSLTILEFINGRTVTKIGNDVFGSQEQLTNITIPNSVINLNNNTFHNNTSVYWLGNYAFIDNIFLESLNEQTEFIIPDIIAGKIIIQIGDYAFEDNTTLTKVTIPSSVAYIGDHAFSNCTNLSQVEISDETTSILGSTPFSGCTQLYNTVVSIRTDYHRIIDDTGRLIWTAHDFVYDDNHSSTHHDLICVTCGFEDTKIHNKQVVNGIEVCSTCPWVGGAHVHHEHTHSYIPIPHSGKFPVNLHKAYCFCGEYIEEMCLGRIAEDGKAYCIHCGRDMTGALGQIINRILLPESDFHDNDIYCVGDGHSNDCCITKDDLLLSELKNVLYMDVKRRERSFYGGA